MGTARVSTAVVLAVDYSALYSFLNLMEGGKTSGNYIHRSCELIEKNNQLETIFFFISVILSSSKYFPYLSTQDAVDHDDDETLQRVKDGKEDLEEGRAAVGDGQDGRHPGEGQEGQNHAGAPQRCSADRKKQITIRHPAMDFYFSASRAPVV